MDQIPWAAIAGSGRCSRQIPFPTFDTTTKFVKGVPRPGSRRVLVLRCQCEVEGEHYQVTHLQTMPAGPSQVLRFEHPVTRGGE